MAHGSWLMAQWLVSRLPLVFQIASLMIFRGSVDFPKLDIETITLLTICKISSLSKKGYSPESLTVLLKNVCSQIRRKTYRTSYLLTCRKANANMLFAWYSCKNNTEFPCRFTLICCSIFFHARVYVKRCIVTTLIRFQDYSKFSTPAIAKAGNTKATSEPVPKTKLSISQCKSAMNEQDPLYTRPFHLNEHFRLRDNKF